MLFAQVHELAVQSIQVLRHHDAVGIVPGAKADAVPCVDCRLVTVGVDAEVGTPGLAPGAGGFSQVLAMGVGASQSTEVGSITGTYAGDVMPMYTTISKTGSVP